MSDARNSGLVIPPAALKRAKQGLGDCLRCRAMLDDAKGIGYDYPNIAQLMEEVQPRLEGTIAFDASQRGLSDDR